MSDKIPLSYYSSDDVVFLARDLLGKVLCTNINGTLTSGIVSETEAYAGINDRASHAYGGRRTSRTEVMFGEGGVSYVYLCYGVHYLFNIVVSEREIPHAVLIRGIYPLEGWETILERRKMSKKSTAVANGPGKLTKALGINMNHNGLALDGDLVWLEDRRLIADDQNILVSKRIGVDYAGEDGNLPYRFNLNLENYVNTSF
jgi:DNA-3-methyladenine glycosylase